MNRLPVLAGAVVFVVTPWVAAPFHITLLNYIGLASIIALGLVLITGVGGMTSFGQAAFAGLGAYTSAYLATVHGVSPWLGLLAGIALAAAAAVLIGAITLRLSGHYLPIGTIAWGICIFYLFANIEGLGRYNGIDGIPGLRIGGQDISAGPSSFYLIWAVVVAAMLLMRNLLDSRLGRAIRTLRAKDLAEAFGVHTRVTKLVIFLYAGVLAAISGWLYAHFVRFVNPTPFGLSASIEYLFMAVAGGAASIWGAVVGAAILTVLKQWLQDVLPQLLGQSGQFEIIVFGLLMVLMFQFARQGVVPLLALRFFKPRRLSVDRSVADLPVRARPERGTPLLEVKAARKQFGGLVAVDDVGFEIRAGEMVGLIGPNGAGKTTMFNLATGLLGPTAGEILFRGERIDALPAREIVRRGLARTFQHVRVRPGMSVLENVALGAHLRGSTGYLHCALRLDREEESRLLKEADSQLRRVGLVERAHDLARSLALGPQRLLEIARALCTDPLLLLLDEPAAGLRHAEKRALADLLRVLRSEGTTILLVEHDMDFVMALADRLVVMDFGKKIAEGTPREVQSNPAVVEAYLGGVA